MAKRLTGAKTVAKAVYESLHQSILTGTLAPGAKLKQDDIATGLGVSRMPVRQALSRLEGEGMVVLETYRGAFVAPLTWAEAEQIYVMRLALEPLLARRATTCLDPASLLRLEGACQDMATALGDDDVDAFFDGVRAFHETLYAAAGKPLILGQVLGLRDLSQRYIRRYLALPGRLAHVVENHFQILEAARRRQALQVERLIRQELEATRDTLCASLGQPDFFSPASETDCSQT